MRYAVLVRGAVFALVGWGVALGPAAAFPPEKPYDPRPLTVEAEKQVTTDKFTFLVFGDVKGGSAFPGLVKQAEAQQPAFVILTGDMVASGTPKLYDHLENQFGAFMRKVPTWPCVGNHETGDQGVKTFYQFYGLKSRHFWFDFRNVRCIGVDAPAKASVGGEELKWLEPLLADGQKAGKHMFLWQHSPPYTVGSKSTGESPGKPTPLTQLCTKYGVVAVFSGHDHIYYRTHRDGVNYIISGVAGAGVYSLKRRGDAIEGDAYYGRVGKGSAVIHTPAGEKTVQGLPCMLTAIQVDGKKVTGKTMTAAGEVVDEFILAPTSEVKAAPAGRKPAEKREPAPVGSGAD